MAESSGSKFDNVWKELTLVNLPRRTEVVNLLPWLGDGI